MRQARARTVGILGVVLIGVALAPPRPAGADPRPEDAGSGALFVRTADGRGWLPAPILETDIALRVTGLVARARVVQRFANPTDRWLEGVYVFPLPEMAAVDHLDMRIGARVIEGRIQERERARKTYRRAKREGRKASLLEQERPNIFTASVANLGPGEVVEVALEYQETLRYEEGGYRLRFPLVVGPRYVPGAPLPAAAPGPVDAGGWAPASAAVLDAPRITPPLLHPDDGPLNPVRLWVELEPGFPLEGLASPSHAIFVRDLAAGRRHRVYLQDYADRDFVLEWRPAAGAEPEAALFSEQRGSEIHALLMVMPPDADVGSPRLSRDVVFVIDTSGSMGGTSIQQARAALRLALDRLGPDDHFNVIQFNHETQLLFESSVRADRDALERARRYVRGLGAHGGTEMLPALRVALATDTGLGDVRQVVFITDGSIGNEQQLFEAIRLGLGRSRLFTVGIGSAPNGFFLKRAAGFGRGTHTFIATAGEVDGRMGELFGKLETPVLSDIEVLWNDAVEMWPRQVPDLYAGEPVVVAARLPRLTGEVVVRGRRGERPWEARLALQPGASARGIGVLWARRKIAALMDSLASGAEPQAVRDAVVRVALEHHLVSRYTSLVAVDVTPTRPAGEGLARAALPTNVPAGWDPAKIGGVLPRTATPAALYRGLGVLLLAAGAALAWTARLRRSGA